MDSQIRGSTAKAGRGSHRMRLVLLVMPVAACIASIGCAVSGPELQLQDEAGEPIFRLSEEQLPQDRGALRSLSVSLEIPGDDSRLLVWWIRHEDGSEPAEALAFTSVRYGRNPEGFRTLVGPEPLQPCSHYAVTMTFVRGTTRIEFETPARAGHEPCHK